MYTPYRRNERARIARRIMNEIECERKREQRPNRDTDTENRKRVMERIEEYRQKGICQKGICQKEAVDLIIQDKKVLEQFDYLTKNGLDIRQCILNWSNKIYREQTSSFEKER